MKNIEEICKEFGIEIPQDKAKEFHSAVVENYKAVEEHNKTIARIELERDTAKNDLKTAQETLEKFKDIDPKKVKEEIAKYKKIAEDSEQNYKDELYKRDFDDALNKAVADIKFTSESAKKAFIADVKEQGFKLGENGTIYGLNDFYNDVKAKDPTAFVDEEKEEAEQKKAKFTTPMNDGSDGSGAKKMTKDEILEMKDSEAQQRAIRENISLFVTPQN